MKLITTALVASSLFLAACANQKDNETLGAAIGGVLGGIAGSQIGGGHARAFTGLGGALFGSWVGTHVARSLNMKDKELYHEAEEEAHNAPVGEEIVWNNEETGTSGTITPVREGRASGGEYCREYQQTVTIDGQTERAYGTACQMPDGSWKIIQ